MEIREGLTYSMNINNILQRIDLNSFKFFHYYEDLLMPFVDGYFKNCLSTKFELFHEYSFRPDLLIPRILELHPDIKSDKKTNAYKNAFANAILPDDLQMGINIPKLKQIISTSNLYDVSLYVGKACFAGRIEDFFLSFNSDSINGYSFKPKNDIYDGYYDTGYVDFGILDKQKCPEMYDEIGKKILDISQRTRRLLDHESR